MKKTKLPEFMRIKRFSLDKKHKRIECGEMLITLSRQITEPEYDLIHDGVHVLYQPDFKWN